LSQKVAPLLEARLLAGIKDAEQRTGRRPPSFQDPPGINFLLDKPPISALTLAQVQDRRQQLLDELKYAILFFLATL
jgi:hypothetical protein